MSGNGVDLGTVVAMLHTVIQAQEAMRAEFGGRLDQQGAAILGIRQEVKDLRLELRADITSVRQEISLYHGSVAGHGVLISELDERVRRLEERSEPARVA